MLHTAGLHFGRSSLIWLFLALGCAHAARTPVSPQPPSSAVSPQPPAPAAELPLRPLTQRESTLKAALAQSVLELAGQIGERNSKQYWELASAADWLVGKFEALGCRVERQGFEINPEVTGQNLVVEFPGKELHREVVLVGAHYDSGAGSPGADDNASGVAALLALATAFQKEPGNRTLRLVAFASYAGSGNDAARRGSSVYSQQSAKHGDNLVAMISLDSLGFFSPLPGSQQRPGEVIQSFPTVGTFGAVMGAESSRSLVMEFADALTRAGSLPIHSAVLKESDQALADSDHVAFAQLGVPGIVVTDTRGLRNPNLATPRDTPDSLDYDRMARLVASVEQAVRGLLSGPVRESRPAPGRALSPPLME